MPVTAAAPRFKRTLWATDAAPAHKSDLNALSSQYACPRKWLYEQQERLAGRSDEDGDRVAYARTAAGSAVHEAIAWFLTTEAWHQRIVAGEAPRIDQVKRVYWEMFDRAVGGRELQYSGKDRPEALHEDRVHMVHGLLLRLHERVHSVELVEAGFIVRLGHHWLSGHVDLVYRPRGAPESIALADWKTGATKPDALELDHGWEAGVYSGALLHGCFLPRETVQVEATGATWTGTCCGVQVQHRSRYRAEREALEQALIAIAQARVPEPQELVRYQQFPDRIHHVHLQDFVPYKRAGKKRVTRPEDLEHYGLTAPGEVAYESGQSKGPAWLPVRRTEHDVPRLLHRVRPLVAMVRLGVFPDHVGERCRRCAFARHCLTSGYAPSGEARDALEQQLRAAGAGSAHQDIDLND